MNYIFRLLVVSRFKGEGRERDLQHQSCAFSVNHWKSSQFINKAKSTGHHKALMKYTYTSNGRLAFTPIRDKPQIVSSRKASWTWYLRMAIVRCTTRPSPLTSPPSGAAGKSFVLKSLCFSSIVIAVSTVGVLAWLVLLAAFQTFHTYPPSLSSSRNSSHACFFLTQIRLKNSFFEPLVAAKIPLVREAVFAKEVKRFPKRVGDR